MSESELTTSEEASALRLRFQIGQPVACGKRGDTAVSALRISASAPILSGTTSATKQQVLLAFDKLNLLSRQFN